MEYSTLTAIELTVACFRSGDESAWLEFIRRFQPLIARVVIRIARQRGDTTTQAIDDLIQDVYLKIFEQRAAFLQRFEPSHDQAVYGFVKVLTANLVHDHFKAKLSLKRGQHVTTSVDALPLAPKADKVAVSHQASMLERSVLVRQIESCLQSITPGSDGRRDRYIFWLYYRAGLTASAIAAIPSIGLTMKGVESTLLRLNRQLRSRLVGVDVPASRSTDGPEGKQSLDSF